MAGIDVDIRVNDKGGSDALRRFRGGLDDAKNAGEKFGSGLNQATRAVDAMVGNIVSQLNPAMGAAATSMSQASSAARNMPVAFGVATVAIAAASVGLSVYIDKLKDAQDFQARLNVAARSADLGAIRSKMREAANALEDWNVQAEAARKLLDNLGSGDAKGVLNSLVGLFRTLGKDTEVFQGNIRRGREELEKLLPLEERVNAAAGRAKDRQFRIQGGGTELGTAERQLDPAKFDAIVKEIQTASVQLADAQRDILRAKAVIDVRGAVSAGIDPGTIQEELRFQLQLVTIEAAIRDRAFADSTGQRRLKLTDTTAARIAGFDAATAGAEGEQGVREFNQGERRRLQTEGLRYDLERLQAARQLEGLSRDEIKALDEGIAKARTRLDLDENLTSSATARLAPLREAIELENIATRDLRELTSGVFASFDQAVSQSIAGIIQGTQTAAGAFQNLGQSIVLSLTNALLKRAFADLENELNKLLIPLAKAGLSGFFGFGGPSVNEVGGVGGASYGPANVQGFASGGIAYRPMLAMVGEHGPEEIRPYGSGGMATTVNIIDQRGSGSIEQRRQRTPNGDEIQVLILDTVRAGINGGSLDPAMGRTYGLSRVSTRR